MRVIEIQPRGNKEYVDKKASEWLIPETFDCVCCGLNSECYLCHGEGSFERTRYPWTVMTDEMTFYAIMVRLGLVPDGKPLQQMGEITPWILMHAVKNAKMKMMMIPIPVLPIGPGVSLAREVTKEGMGRLLQHLRNIADEAERREENVVWNSPKMI